MLRTAISGYFTLLYLPTESDESQITTSDSDSLALKRLWRFINVLLTWHTIRYKLEMWANAQRDGRPAEYRWRLLFNAAKLFTSLLACLHVYPSGRGPAYSGPIRGGLFVAGPLR